MARRHRSAVLPGQIRRQELLGSEAAYEVLEVEGRRVQVAVLDAPGLECGMRIWLTLDAIAAMACETVPELVTGRPAARPARAPYEAPAQP
ncbi:MAG TPA: hypothetical protein VHB30_14290 [Solirubrobacteraceae bacterium]|jgi:hypothetical protein|nr:hypothetical protein [Solirubrobacteraceae bacterium]